MSEIDEIPPDTIVEILIFFEKSIVSSIFGPFLVPSLLMSV